jgi:hypothetical protein
MILKEVKLYIFLLTPFDLTLYHVFIIGRLYNTVCPVIGVSISKGPNRVGVSLLLRTETDSFFEALWSLTLREEHRLKVFENRVLKRIYGPRKNEVT